MRVSASPINTPPQASRMSNRPRPSQLRTNQEIAERKDSAFSIREYRLSIKPQKGIWGDLSRRFRNPM